MSSCPKSLTPWRRCAPRCLFLLRHNRIKYAEHKDVFFLLEWIWKYTFFLTLFLILPLLGEVPGQRCYSSRGNRRKRILHHPQRRGNNILTCVFGQSHPVFIQPVSQTHISLVCITFILSVCLPVCLFPLQVLVTKNVNGHQKQIRRMGKGEHFGEQALIR